MNQVVKMINSNIGGTLQPKLTFEEFTRKNNLTFYKPEKIKNSYVVILCSASAFRAILTTCNRRSRGSSRLRPTPMPRSRECARASNAASSASASPANRSAPGSQANLSIRGRPRCQAIFKTGTWKRSWSAIFLTMKRAACWSWPDAPASARLPWSAVCCNP